MLTIKLCDKRVPSVVAEAYLNSLSSLLSIQSTISYYPQRADKNKLKIDIDRDRMSVDDAINEVKDIINGGKYSKQFKRLYRVIESRGMKPNELLINNEKLIFKAPDDLDIKVKEITNSHGDKLTLIADPLINNSAAFVDLSVSHNDIDFGWNYLHLFEHLCCIDLIDNYDKNELTNGYTLPTGVSIIYSETSTPDASAKIMKRMQKIWNSSRDGKLVADYKQQIQREIERTRSESKQERSLFNYARSSEEYETDVFDYWFNSNFKGYIVGKTFPSNANSILELHAPRHVDKPISITFKSIPLSNLQMKQLYKAKSCPLDIDLLSKNLNYTFSTYEMGADHTFYGKDIEIKFNIISDSNYPIDFIVAIPNRYGLKLLKMYYFDSVSDLFDR